jgi:hypothetical protein
MPFQLLESVNIVRGEEGRGKLSLEFECSEESEPNRTWHSYQILIKGKSKSPSTNCIKQQLKTWFLQF